jgi:hypothetical protein
MMSYADKSYGYAFLSAEISERYSCPDLSRRPVEEWAPELGIDAEALKTLAKMETISILEALEDLDVTDPEQEIRRIIDEVFATGWVAQRRWRNRRRS